MDALALLRLQVEWGADEALEDAPVNRLREGQAGGTEPRHPLPLRAWAAEQTKDGGRGRTVPSRDRTQRAGQQVHFDPSPLPPPSRGGGARTPPPSSTPAERATAAAGQAQTLDDLCAAVAAFDGCALRDTAANLVFAAGDPTASLMLIGDPPGEAEDRSGTPFAGPDGALLDRMLASIGLNRETLLLTPLIPWRPPGGRPPNPGEMAVCLPFLHRLISLASPSRVLLVGALAARTMLGSTRRRTTPAWVEVVIPGTTQRLPMLAMPGPTMVARTPGARREAWAALRLLRRTLDTDLAET